MSIRRFSYSLSTYFLTVFLLIPNAFPIVLKHQYKTKGFISSPFQPNDKDDFNRYVFGKIGTRRLQERWTSQCGYIFKRIIMHAVPITARTIPITKKTIILWWILLYSSAVPSYTWKYPDRCNIANNKNKTQKTILTMPTINNSFFMLSSCKFKFVTLFFYGAFQFFPDILHF